MEAKRENLHKTIRSTLALVGQGGQEEGKKNMDNSRDTQFAGFAEKLYQEIEDLTCSFSVLPSADEMKRLECEIYARRAYDLVLHALSHEKLSWYPLEEISVSDIPDLTELPGQNQPE